MSDDKALTPAQKGAATRQARHRLRRRNEQALEMYYAGATLQAISDQLGWKTRSAAQKAIARALAEAQPLTPAETEDAKRKMLGVLDKLHGAQYLNALRGDTRSTQLVLAILDRRVKLLGIDQVKDGGPLAAGSELDSEIEALLRGIPNIDTRPALEAPDADPAD